VRKENREEREKLELKDQEALKESEEPWGCRAPKERWVPEVTMEIQDPKAFRGQLETWDREE